jgi:hypothetical protein
MRCQKTGGWGRPWPRSSRAATWADRQASEVPAGIIPYT